MEDQSDALSKSPAANLKLHDQSIPHKEASKKILKQLRLIIRSLSIESKKIHKSYGITTPQLICLNHLHGCKDFKATHKELTAALHLNPSTVTGIVDRLAKKGLVAKLPKQLDKRRTYICLTMEGEKLLLLKPDLLQERLQGKLEKSDPQALSSLLNSLEWLTNALDIQEEIDSAPYLTIEEPLEKD